MLAAEALDLPKGSEVITAAFTFATTVTPILKNNLKPVFIDSEKDTLNIDANRIEQFINKNTSALWIPNMLGNVPDWDIIRKVADKYGYTLVDHKLELYGVKKKP